MMDEVHAHAGEHAAEDDFELVNAWAAASTRSGKRLPQAAVSFEKAAPKTPELKTPYLKTPDLAAVSLIDAPPLAESSPLHDGAAPEPHAVALRPRATGQDASMPASPVAGMVHAPHVHSEPEGLQPDAAAATASAHGEDLIPQSTAEVEPLPAAPAHTQSSRRRPWTSLFRLITSDASESLRDQTASIATDETVREPPPVESEFELADQQDDADIPLAPDQLERDIAEIELVRDQLLSEPPSSHVAGGVPGSRTSDNVPILVGGALGFILLVVFGAAASFVSLR